MDNFAGYGARRDAINSGFAANMAANNYSNFLSQQRGSRQMADAYRNFGRQFPTFNASFGRRGLAGGGVRSGVQQRALSNLAADFARGQTDIQTQMASEQSAADFRNASMAAERQRALADLEFEKQQAINNTAMGLLQMRPLMGG